MKKMMLFWTCIMIILLSGLSHAACTGSKEVKTDFTFGDAAKGYPKDGARIWIPEQANCVGTYPLVVFLHGCQNVPHQYFYDNSANDIVKTAKSLYSQN